MNKLYYGNNLDVLRETVATESVDLIYLDPPFNSKRDYNLLFKSPKAPAGGAVDSRVVVEETKIVEVYDVNSSFLEAARQRQFVG